jgi:hypothetical protein
MEFGPITGIRAVSLLNIQKAADRVAPRFETEASERPGDEPSGSSNQEAAERGLEEENAQEPAATESDAESTESESDGSFNWFV